MFAQAVPESEQSWDEFLNKPLEKVVDMCIGRVDDLTMQLALNALDAEPERFKAAISEAFQQLSDERKALVLRERMENMTYLRCGTIRTRLSAQ